MRPLTGLVPLVTLLVAAPLAGLPAVFEVDGGYLSGFAANAEGSVTAFLGIPYAAPPVGERRWRPPRPVLPWPALREALGFGPACPQAPYPPGIYPSPSEEKDEDCLYLNVWTGAEGVGERRPVMVWIHGGALTLGSASRPTFDGTRLAEKGVVAVSINYRLGALGYLALRALTAESEHGSSGNYGVLDQIAALRWVRRNIRLFGGDPANVTIFGESAGSWSVNALMASPLAKGLFHRAIGQSGGLFADLPRLQEAVAGVESAEAVGAAFAERLGISAGEGALAALRALPAERLVAAAGEEGAFRTRPNEDGWVLPRSVYETFAAGEHADVPVIVGLTANEMTSLTAAVPDSRSSLEARWRERFGADASHLLEIYGVTEDAQAGEAFLTFGRDDFFTWQMRTWAELMRTVSSPAYLYLFSRAPRREDWERLGAYHGAEIMYAFDNLEHAPVEITTDDRRLAEQVSALWVSFARTGRPAADGVPGWPAYDAEEGAYLELDAEPGVRHHLAKEACDWLDRYHAARRGD